MALLISCSVLQPTIKKPSESPDRDVVRAPTTSGEMDTIRLRQVPESEYPPITQRTAVLPTPKTKEVYRVVLMAPFESKTVVSQMGKLSSRTARLIEFMEGVRYYLENKETPVRVHLDIIDTDYDPQFLNNFEKNPAITNADLILGPYFTEQIETIARYGLEHGKYVISPWNTNELSNPNPYYIQLRPSLKTHARKMADYVSGHFPHEEIVILTKNQPRDIEALDFFQNPTGPGQSKKFREKRINNAADSRLGDTLISYVQNQGYRAFIVPVWQDEAFVISLLSKLNFAKADLPVTVFGLPQWMEMPRMDYDYFENLQVHLTSPRPVAEAGSALRSAFISKYADIPGQDLFYGYQVMEWLTGLLASSGADLKNGLNASTHVKGFQINAILDTDGEKIHHYENQQLYFWRFTGYRYEQVAE